MASSLELVIALIINKKEKEQILGWHQEFIYGFVDASGSSGCYRAGIDERLMAAATHHFRDENGLVQVERHADDDLDADSGKQVFMNAGPVIL